MARSAAHIARTIAFVTLFATTASAQVIRPSQAGAVMQWVANTKIEISYHRPVARGRELFGKLVPFDKVWSPSADSAAVVTISTPITVATTKDTPQR